jgi:hypothetical protein
VHIHDLVRETYVRKATIEAAGVRGEGGTNTPAEVPSSNQHKVSDTSESVEVTHILCGMKGQNPDELLTRTDVIIETAISGLLQGNDNRLCEVRQLAKGVWYELGHAHHQKNYCHGVAENIARRRQDRGFVCFGSIGVRAPAEQQSEATQQKVAQSPNGL